MLVMPEGEEPLRVLAFDPGSYNMGIARFTWTLDAPKVCVSANTVYASDTERGYAPIREVYGTLVARIMALQSAAAEAINDFRPHCIIVESNYMGKFADAYSALVQCVTAIRTAAYHYDPYLPFYQVDPPTAKKAAGVVKIKGAVKDDVRTALMKQSGIDWLTPISDLDEHAVDAVAVGFYLVKTYLE